MRDFGPHKKLDCDFREGLNLIYGGNGAGKSNTVYAIGWALMGPGALPSDVKQGDIIRDGAEQAKAVVEIDINGKRHKFRRTYNGKQVSASVSTLDTKGNETRVAETPTGVSAYLAELGFDLESFGVLVSMQDDLTQILKARPAERIKLFDRLMNAATINGAIASAGEHSNADVHRPAILDLNLVTQADDRATNTFKINYYEKAVSDLDEQLVESQLIVSKKRAILANFKSLSDDLRDVASERQKIKTEIDAVRSEIVMQDSLKGMFESDIPQASLVLDLCFAKGKIHEKESLLYKASKLYDEGQSKSQNLSGQLKALNLFNEAISQDNVCLACGSSEPDHGKLGENIAEKSETLVEVNSALEDSRHAKSSMMLEIDKLRDEIMDLQTSIENTAEYEKADKAILGLHIRLTILLADYENALAKIADVSGRLPDDEFMEGLRSAEDTQIEQSENLRVARNKRDTLIRDNRAIDSQLEYYQKELVSFNEDTAIKSEFRETVKELKRFKNYLILEALTWVSDRSTQILQRIDSLPDIQANSKIVIDPKLEFWISTDGVLTPVRRFSGGQKAAFSVCLRIALSEFFSSRLGLNGMLILDAAFESMDNTNREATAIALESTGQKQALIFMYEDVASLDAHRIEIING